MNLKILQVNYLDPAQSQDLSYLMNSYALDPMGGGGPLSEEVLKNLSSELAKLPHAFSIIAYVNTQPAGLINCFEAFSTFNCKPLINIHDAIVLEEFRSQGINQMMLEKVEEIARFKGCCKITLEVLSGNIKAKGSYTNFGFSDYVLDEKMGSALFWQKKLT